MIISKKHKFIFIHIPKTAGSSINTALLESLGGDVKCPLTYQLNGESFCVNHAEVSSTTLDPKEVRKGGLQPVYFESSTDFAHSHYPINKFMCGGEIDDPSYFSFSFARNPFDRIVSAYTYAQRRLEFEENNNNVDPGFNLNSFADFCKNYLTNQNFCDPVTKYNIHFLPQYRFIYAPHELLLEDGNPFVSHVGRFENLQEDFNYICDKIGIEEINLPRVRDQKNKKQYHEYYSEECKEIVEEVYKKDLELFNYDFNKPATKTYIPMTRETLDYTHKLKDLWIPMTEMKEIFEYANQYIPTSNSEASMKEGDTSFNSDKPIAILASQNKGCWKHAVETENNILHYANKHNYAAYLYREEGRSIPESLLNHIKSHEYIIYIGDSSLFVNFEKRIEDVISKHKRRFLVADEGLNAILIKSHKYTENLLKKWQKGDGILTDILAASDPSKFNYKIVSEPSFCATPDESTKETFISNFSNTSEEQKIFFMRMWNVNNLPS